MFVVAAVVAACGTGSEPSGPFIEAFRAEPAHLSPGEPVELVVEFGGGSGRIEPDVGTVQPGVRVRVGPFASGMTYRLIVSDGTRTAERELALDLQYRHRLSAITPSGTARVDHSAAVLSDGRVLVFGGRSPSFTGWVSSELFDPASGHFTASGDLPTTRWNAAWAGVSDGRIVAAGGETNAARFDEATQVLVWSAGSGEWTTAGQLREFRIGHSATRLPLEGNVLLVAGGDFYLQSPDRVTPAEILDVDHATSRAPKGAMVEPRLAHSATRLVDGRILLAGGLNAFTNVEVSNAEVYDATTESFSPACLLTSEQGTETDTPRPPLRRPWWPEPATSGAAPGGEKLDSHQASARRRPRRGASHARSRKYAESNGADRPPTRTPPSTTRCQTLRQRCQRARRASPISA